MDKQAQHIKQWIASKGIKIVYVCGNGSYFDHDSPDTIFIARYTDHGLLAATLHEYYHARQLMRQKLDVNKTGIKEYQAESFVIRCFKRLGITYSTTFIEHYWRDRATTFSGDSSPYYTAAYKLLIKNNSLAYIYNR